MGITKRLRFTVALVLAFALLAACSSKPPATEPGTSSPSGGTTTGGQTATGEPDLDATLRVVLESAPPHLDNQLTTARLGRTVTDPIHVFLVRHDKDMNLHNYLAKEWEQVDELTYRFTIHEGVKFHNGRELVADDIKKSMERSSTRTPVPSCGPTSSTWTRSPSSVITRSSSS